MQLPKPSCPSRSLTLHSFFHSALPDTPFSSLPASPPVFLISCSFLLSIPILYWSLSPAVLPFFLSIKLQFIPKLLLAPHSPPVPLLSPLPSQQTPTMDSGPRWAADPIPGGTLLAPNATTPWLGRDEELAKVEIGVLAVVLVLATAGNLTVLLTLGQQGRQRARMHLFVRHLALTDLGMAVFQVLPQLLWDITYRFQGPDLVCRAVKYLQALSMFASTYMLLAMTLDRYLAVCHPLRSLQQPSQSAYPLIAAPWLLAAILSLPQVFIFSLREVTQGSGVLDCWADFRFSWGPRAYITWTALAIFILPVAMLTACYSLICYEICKNLKVKTQTWRVEGGGSRTQDRASPLGPAAATRGLPSRVSSISTISRAKIRTVKMTFIIVLAYIACWAPFFSVQMWTVWDKNAPNEGKCVVRMWWGEGWRRGEEVGASGEEQGRASRRIRTGPQCLPGHPFLPACGVHHHEPVPQSHVPHLCRVIFYSARASLSKECSRVLSYKPCAPSGKWKPFGALFTGLRSISLNLLSSPPSLPPQHTGLLASCPWVFVRGCPSPCPAPTAG